jgi:hypothetical protein
MQNWVQSVSSSRNKPRLWLALSHIPRAQISPRALLTSSTSTQLQCTFNPFTIADYQSVFSWIHHLLSEVNGERSYNISYIRSFTSPLYFLFEVILNSLKKKEIYSCFDPKDKVFCSVNQQFIELQRRGLIWP